MSQVFLDVIPECYIDTYLVAFLLQADRVNHQHSCNKVTGTMNMKADVFCVGIVDYDKAKKDIYHQHWTLLANGTEKKLHMLFFKHQTEPHYLIAISPAMEKYVLTCAEDLKVDLSALGLPSNLDEFRHLTKNGKLTPKDIRFKRLFKAIEKHPNVSTLQKILQYLITYKHNSLESDIQAIIAEGMV